MDSSFRRNQYGVKTKTLRGETVKSQGEKQIADYFLENRIKYTYEDQAKTEVSAFRSEISHPDFYLPDYQVYVEFWGLIDVGESKDRERYRKNMDWKKEQYANNGIKLISLYPWNLNDLDGSFKAEFEKVLGRELVTGPVGEKSVYALPISKDFEKWLLNDIPSKLMSRTLQLVYLPYFFVEYDCFAQTRFFYETVNLESHGMLVIEGQNGAVADIALHSGVSPQIQQTGCFSGCAVIQQRELERSKIAQMASFSKIEAFPTKISRSDAERIARVEIAKHLQQTFRKQLKNRVETKTLRPYENNVRIISVDLMHVPLVTGVFQYKNRVYQRMMQSTTCRIVGDDFAYCNVTERNHPTESVILCEECGGLACKDHGKQCVDCEKNLCVEHIRSKGLVLKKYYCPRHYPK